MKEKLFKNNRIMNMENRKYPIFWITFLSQKQKQKRSKSDNFFIYGSNKIIMKTIVLEEN